MCILRGTQISLCVLSSLFILFLTPNFSLSHPKNPQEFRAVPLHFKPASRKYASEIHHLPSNSHHVHCSFSLKLPIVLGWEYRDACLKKKNKNKASQLNTQAHLHLFHSGSWSKGNDKFFELFRQCQLSNHLQMEVGLHSKEFRYYPQERTGGQNLKQEKQQIRRLRFPS